MPFTPFHMGPGMALKSLAGDRFSLITFGAAQVVIDIEPGIGLLRGSEVLHGWTHTYAGATVIAAAVVALRPVWLGVLRSWNAQLRHHELDWMASRDVLGWSAAAAGAFIGTYTHIVLDSVMHADIRPFAPFSNANGLYEVISLPALHGTCAILGVAGLAAWIVARRLGRART